MEDDFYVPHDWEEITGSIIKVVGVGGGGSNAVNYMYATGIKNVDFVVCNTDAQSLAISPVPYKVQLGSTGLGAGCDPERGRKAAEESEDKIRTLLSDNTKMVFITAGMGGGTGTGAAPVIARIAREMKLLTVGVVTVPFRHEGYKFIERAFVGIREMKRHVDSLLIIDNQRLYDLYGNLTVFDAFPKADEVLTIAVKGIAEIITRPGFINIDFADVEMAMKDSGVAIMGSGKANGERRALEAVEKALSSPLLNDSDVSGAKNVLVNITSSGTEQALTMSELEKIMHYVQEKTGAIENCKRGVVRDDSMDDFISVTIVATGFRMNVIDLAMSAQAPASDNTSEEPIEIVFHPLKDDRFDDDDDNDEEGETPPSPLITSDETTPAPHSDDEITLAPNQRVYKIDNPQPDPAATPPSPAAPTLRTVIPPAKPVLIVDKETDINRLEKEPAFRRRNNITVAPPTSTDVSHAAPENTARIVNINGIHKLNTDNTYLYPSID
ncbi:MAG: cell division protein FtsZ [Prevotellaceae bacterium]|jgi:cell division protein FtsZ|nr:cell division protein FtsZ [Prevotellaceae bacterium]